MIKKKNVLVFLCFFYVVCIWGEGVDFRCYFIHLNLCYVAALTGAVTM